MIAALILAHYSPDLLGRLVKRLSQYGVRCFVHVDAKVDIGPFCEACAATDAEFIEPRIEVRWGGFSIVAATISLLRAAISHVQFSHFILTSGDSYPIKPREQFCQLVMRPFEQIVFNVVPPRDPVFQRIARTFLPDTRVGAFLNREGDPTVQRFVTEDTLAALDRIGRVFEMKKAGFPWRYAKGGQWWVLTRTTAQRCLDIIARETELIDWFTYSSVPDESFFHTILENFGPIEVGKGTPVYTEWGRMPRPYVFAERLDLEVLKNAPAPLARKLSIRDGAELLDLLDDWMGIA
jgi:hypothetical protein